MTAKRTVSMDEETLKKLIEDGIQKAISAGRIAQQEDSKTPYKATERRLYALPHLEEKLAIDKENLEYLEGDEFSCGHFQGKSKSIVRFSATGIRVSPEQQAEALVQDIRARMAADEEEIRMVRKALDAIKPDCYYRTVEARYFENLHDDLVAEELFCDASTVRRNRSRLVRIVAIRLYGSKAI